MQQIIEKVEHYIWEGKVKEWKMCPQCGSYWTPLSFVKGLCPECRGVKVEEVYSQAIKELQKVYEQNGYQFDEKAKEIVSDEKKLIKCSKCAKLVLSAIEYNNKLVCQDCWYILKYKEKNKQVEKYEEYEL